MKALRLFDISILEKLVSLTLKLAVLKPPRVCGVILVTETATS